jgi:hypothetical protein
MADIRDAEEVIRTHDDQINECLLKQMEEKARERADHTREYSSLGMSFHFSPLSFHCNLHFFHSEKAYNSSIMEYQKIVSVKDRLGVWRDDLITTAQNLEKDFEEAQANGYVGYYIYYFSNWVSFHTHNTGMRKKFVKSKRKSAL